MPIGTKVRLGSGGLDMIVVDLRPATFEVLCAWPDGEAWFKVVCLDVVRTIHLIG